jgi:hypothetical protein
VLGEAAARAQAVTRPLRSKANLAVRELGKGGTPLRTGWTFKRCCRCGLRMSADQCERCRGRTFTWTFVMDTAPVGFPRHQKKKGGFATRADATAAMRRLTEDPTGQLDPVTVTTGEYLRDWLMQVKTDGSIRPTTAKAYDVAIRVHILPGLGRVPLRELSRKMIKEHYEFLRHRGRARGRVGVLSPKSVHNIHLTLHRALEEAVDDGLLRSNPASRAHRLGYQKPELRTWAASELHSFLVHVHDDPNFALWRSTRRSCRNDWATPA